MNKLERTTPAAAGIDAKRMEAALKKLAAPRYGVHALLVLKGGKVVAERYREPYRAGEVHSLFSVSKSFTAAAIGFAEQDGPAAPRGLRDGLFPGIPPRASLRKHAEDVHLAPIDTVGGV